jgi:hypothetical protein
VSYRPASDKLPLVGATWKYSYTDLQYGRVQRQFTVRVDAVDGWVVSETFSPEGATGRQRVRFEIGADEARFIERSLGSGRTALELNPYFASYDWGRRGADPVAGYPAGSGDQWQTRTSISPNVAVEVPAGRFNTVMVQIKGTRNANQNMSQLSEAARFEVTAWYSSEARRYVRLENRLWSGTLALMGEERIDLLEMSGN